MRPKDPKKLAAAVIGLEAWAIAGAGPPYPASTRCWTTKCRLWRRMRNRINQSTIAVTARPPSKPPTSLGVKFESLLEPPPESLPEELDGDVLPEVVLPVPETIPTPPPITPLSDAPVVDVDIGINTSDLVVVAGDFVDEIVPSLLAAGAGLA